MPLSFYTYNKNLKGIASHWSFVSKDKRVVLTLKKQSSWDEQTQTGKFVDGEYCCVKLSLEEIGKIIKVIESKKNRTISFKREYGNLITYITFEKKTVETQEGLKIVHYIKIERFNGQTKSWRTAFNEGRIIIIREFLKFALKHIFSAIYSEDKKNGQERQKQREKAEKENEDKFNSDISEREQAEAYHRQNYLESQQFHPVPKESEENEFINEESQEEIERDIAEVSLEDTPPETLEAFIKNEENKYNDFEIASPDEPNNFF